MDVRMHLWVMLACGEKRGDRSGHAGGTGCHLHAFGNIHSCVRARDLAWSVTSYRAKNPLSTGKVCPVTIEEALLARNSTAPTTSAISATRPIGVIRSISAISWG